MKFFGKDLALAATVSAIALLGNYIEAGWLQLPAGLVLVAWLPGYFILRVLGLWQKESWPVRFGLGVVISTIISTALFATVIGSSQIQEWRYWAVGIAYVSLLAVVAQYSAPVTARPRITIWQAAAVALPPLFFAVRLLINPFLVDQDGANYIDIMQHIERFGSDGSFLYPRRAFFTHLIMSLHFITGTGFLELFKYLLPGLFWAGLPLLFGVGRSYKATSWQNLIIVLIPLSSAAFIGSVDRFKPEGAVWLAALGAAYFYWLYLREKKVQYFLAGLVIAVIANFLHDTGTILLAVYGIGGGIQLLLRYWRVLTAKFSWKVAAVGGLIALPYILLFRLHQLPGLIIASLANFELDFTGVRWQFWFIDSYQSAGAQLGWPGWLFVIYYGFNGVAIVLLALWLIWKKAGEALVPAILFLLYLVTAELLPRLGIFVLPDRAMVQTFFWAVITVAFLWPHARNSRIINLVLSLLIVVGIVGSCIVAEGEGTLISRRDQNLLAQLRQTEENAVIISSQSTNDVLVRTYANRLFAVAPSPAQAGISNGDDLTVFISQLLRDQNIVIAAPDQVTTITTPYQRVVTVYGNGDFVSGKEVAGMPEERVEKQALLQDPSVPLYFLYSFAKTEGLMARIGRPYWNTLIDTASLGIMQTIIPGNYFYRDQSGILLKLR